MFSAGCRIGEIVTLKGVELIAQTDLPLLERKEIKKKKFILISAVKFVFNARALLEVFL